MKFVAHNVYNNIPRKLQRKLEREIVKFFKKNDIDIDIDFVRHETNFETYPTFTNGEDKTFIDYDWFDINITTPHWEKDRNLFFLDTAENYRRNGSTGKIWGYQVTPNILVWEYFVNIDEKVSRRVADRRYWQPVYTYVHEIAHGIVEQQNKPDHLHDWINRGDFVKFFTEYLGLKKKRNRT